MKVLLKSLFVLLTVCSLSLPVYADPVERAASPELTVPKAMRLLQSHGYHDFRKIKVERDDHEIEVEARNADGHRVEIEMDLFSGQILAVERD
ncbi:PepSY domain-containing protein [Photobacterium lutimaris]|uniref:PepSY domain-containing protein n=1 Tax=Photobacterium lutimaris TaxID=388278 RepID=A0A2T3J3Q0_9GAMM|nr:PepSY domain-containing protein [Photobacterium lutimaris]PSU35905.1 PepSY domain-containing protein [Photobacterium lutimaris]TDR78980.1 YpeB-like protein with putative protease inhibitory function [Photobacterium lutimaris]